MTQVFAPLTWNSDRTTIDARTKRTKVGGSWRNHLKRNQAWAPINTDIPSDRSVEAFPGCVQLPASSQGWADICIDGTFSMKRHIEEGNGNNAEPDFEMSLAVETQHNITGHISETNSAQMVYPDAWDSADLKLGLWRGRSVRIEKVVEIKSMPSGDSEFIDYSFLIRSSNAQVLAGAGHNVSPWDESGHAELDNADAFVSLAGSQLRGTVLRTPVAWYYVAGELVRVPVLVTFDVQSDGETVRATKHIPRTLIATALAAGSHLFTDATFSPDASPETSTVDGYTRKSNGTGSWSSLVTGAGNTTEDGWSNKSGPQATYWAGDWTSIWRLWAGFDTSSIGAGQQIDTTALTLYKYNNQGPSTEWDSDYLNVYEAVPATATALATSDHANMGTTTLSDTGITNYRFEHDAAGTAFEWTFNASGLLVVDPDGLTQLGVAYEDDRSDTTPPTPGGNKTFGGNFYMAESAGSDPELDVTHSVPSTSSPAALMLL